MTREPCVAGQFYSSNPRALREAVDSYLVTGDPSPVEAKAVVSPHAGYMYSGHVAGAVFSSVRLPRYFLILGPNHQGRGAPLALAPPAGWRTPFGTAPVDPQLNALLLEACPGLQEDRIAHRDEHSLEVQLPFLQRLVPDLRFAAICVGTSSYTALETLGRAVAQVVKGWPGPILMVSSSDMNHYESAEVGRRKDEYAIKRIVALDPRGLYDVVHQEDISMCGYAPTVAALTACRDLGATEGRLIRYANSGDISGDYDRVVGYAGIAVV